MNKPSLKEQHEIAIGNALLQSLRCDAQFICHGEDDGEPDLIYSIAPRSIGIEIATAYYDNAQARVEWQLAQRRLKPDSSGLTKIGFWSEPGKLIFSSVQED